MERREVWRNKKGRRDKKREGGGRGMDRENERMEG